MQISDAVIPVGLQLWWIAFSLICNILHIVISLIQ